MAYGYIMQCLDEAREIRDNIREYADASWISHEEKENFIFNTHARIKSFKQAIDRDIEMMSIKYPLLNKVQKALEGCIYILEGTDISYYQYIIRSVDGLISNIVFDLEWNDMGPVAIDIVRSHLDSVNRIIKYLIEVKVNSYEDIFTLGPEIIFRFQDLSRNLEDVDIKLGLPSDNEYVNRCERAHAYIERAVFPQLEQDSALTLKINGFALQINNFINGGAFLYI